MIGRVGQRAGDKAKTEANAAARGPSPLSHPVAVHALSGGGVDILLTPRPSVLEELAQDLKIPAVRSLTAKFLLEPGRGGSVRVTGAVEAVVTQICVVTLEPFDSEIDEPIDVLFAPWARSEESVNLGHDLDEPDPPDPLEGGMIDVGQLAAEFLALALDPYPRRPDAELVHDNEDAPAPSAFAVLAALKKDGG